MTMTTGPARFSPELIEAAKQCAVRVITSIEMDYQLRAPRSDAERQSGFAIWLQKYRKKYSSLVNAELVQTLEGRQSSFDENTIERLTDEEVWPRIAQRLREYAVLFCASKWASHNMGDAIVMHHPEFMGSSWQVGIGIKNVSDRIGQIVLDEDGSVILDQTTSNLQTNDSLHDYILPAVEAANR